MSTAKGLRGRMIRERASGVLTVAHSAYAFFMRALSDQQMPFLFAFAVLGTITIRIHTLYPLGPGLDHHYHLMNAAMNARSTSEPVRTLYRSINPLDSNTLLYTISYPFEKLTNPVRAFQIACTIMYYLGYPFACAYGLIRTGRSPWGSLLAFPMVYGLSSYWAGFWPYLTASVIIVPAMAEMEVLHRSRGRQAWNAGIACAVLCALTFLAHATVFGWLSILLAIHTLMMMGWKCGLEGLANPRAGLRRAFWVGLRSLAVITPASFLVLRWYWSVMHGSAKAPSGLTMPMPPEPTMAAKIFNMLDYLAPTSGEHEHLYMALLGVVSFAALIYGARHHDAKGPRIFERSFILTVLSFVAFPMWFEYESTASRQFDNAVLMFPLMLFPARPRLRSPAAFALVLMFAFCAMRLRYVGDQLKLLNEVDYAGLIAGAESCKRLVPHDRVIKMAFVNARMPITAFRTGGSYQSHETFAAVCGIDTPVYDTQIYPHNLLPLRYVGAIPAPVTIINNPHLWYEHPNLWTDFDYVLVRAWTMGHVDDVALSKHAQLVAKYGQYELWGRK